MATVKKFEDLLIWQEARKLAKSVYEVTNAGAFAKDYGLRDQLRRAAVSVGSNIVEGFERNGNKEFQKFLWIAKGSAGEVASQLYTAMDIGYLSDPEFEELYECARHCSYLIYKFICSMRKTSISGERYKTSQTSQTPQTSQTSQTSQTLQS